METLQGFPGEGFLWIIILFVAYLYGRYKEKKKHERKNKRRLYAANLKKQ